MPKDDKTRLTAWRETRTLFERYGRPIRQEAAACCMTDAVQRNDVSCGDNNCGAGSACPTCVHVLGDEATPDVHSSDEPATLCDEPATLQASAVEMPATCTDTSSEEDGVPDSPPLASEPVFELTLQCTANAQQRPDCSDLAAGLRAWALRENITQAALTSLLKVLKSCPSDASCLPSDARTLLRTPRDTLRSAVTIMPPGHYCHLGLEHQLRNALALADAPPGGSITLQFSFDGLPISKSSRKELWPIQCRILEHHDAAPFVIGVWAGAGKPDSAEEYLAQFLTELKQLMRNGMSFDGRVIQVSVHSFICDAPARAFVYCIKPHMAHLGCPKCTVEGDNLNHRAYFPPVISTLRTDESVRLQTDYEHHLGVSPLTTLPIDIVSTAPLDYMHLLCLGVTKKLLDLWFRGPYQKPFEVRFGPDERKQLSKLTLSLGPHVPKEFARKPRSTSEVQHWKATELRFFLLYSGPVVLKSVLRSDRYKNFLALHCATFLVSSPTLCTQYVDYAESLYKHFVETFAILYGTDRVSYNVHCVLHLANDVRNFGPVDAFSAFPFENNMQFLKRLLRGQNTPLAQLYNRLKEREGKLAARTSSSARNSSSDIFQLVQEHKGCLLPPGLTPPQYRCAEFRDFTLTVNPPNNCCVVDNSIIIADSFARTTSTQAPCIVGREFTDKKDFYTRPFPSSSIGIFAVSQLSGTRFWPMRNVQKLVRLPSHNQSVVIPFLHTV